MAWLDRLTLHLAMYIDLKIPIALQTAQDLSVRQTHMFLYRLRCM
jgi:hypothetical protein